MKYYFEETTAKKIKEKKRRTIVNTLNRDMKNTRQIYTHFDLPLAQYSSESQE